MTPQEVTAEVTASGIQGRGGAAFPDGPQVGGRELERRPAALSVRQRRRGRAGHLQGPLDSRERAAPAARVDADRGVRAAGAPRVRLHPRRVRPALPPSRRRAGGGVRGRLLRRRHSRHRLRLRPRDLSRRRILRLRRGVGADHLDRGQARLSAQPAAAPDRARPVSEADRHQQRRDAVQHRLDHRARRARRSSKVGTAKNPGTRLISISGHINRPGVYEIEIGYPWAKFIYEDCGGILGGRALKGIIPGRHLDQGADRRRRSSRCTSTTRRWRPPARRWARAA